MREAAFIQRNRPRWEAFEKVVNRPQSAAPDHLAELFVQITDDLSFARTQYPTSRTTKYLNALASKIHLEIYKNRKRKRAVSSPFGKPNSRKSCTKHASRCFMLLPFSWWPA